MSQHFPQLYERGSGDIDVELDLSNYARKVDLKGVTVAGVDTSNLAPKSDLPSLKAEIHETDIHDR